MWERIDEPRGPRKNGQRQWRTGGKVKSGKALLGHISKGTKVTRQPSKAFQKRMDVDDFSFRKVTMHVSDSKSQH